MSSRTYGRNGNRGGRGYSHGPTPNFSDASRLATSGLLNFKAGVKTNAVSFNHWLLRVREKINIKHTRFGLHNIIDREGIIGDYDPPVVPEEPTDPANIIEMTMWKSRVSKYLKDQDEFIQHKLEVSALIWAEIGKDSRTRMLEFNNGLASAAKLDLDDPIATATLAMRTHLQDTHLDNAQNLELAEKSYVNIRMYDYESVSDFKNRFEIIENTYSVLLMSNNMTTDNVLIKLGTPADRSRKFIHALDLSRFGRHISKYRSQDREYPETITEAYNQAVAFSVDKPEVHRRNVFLTHSVGGGPTTASSRPHKPKCYRCGAVGHFSNVCKNRLGDKMPAESDGRGRKLNPRVGNNSSKCTDVAGRKIN
jgi:Zinc knuckle